MKNIYSSNCIDSNQIICTFYYLQPRNWQEKCSAGHGAIPVRIGSVSGIAGRGDSSLIRPVPDAETLPLSIQTAKLNARKLFNLKNKKKIQKVK